MINWIDIRADELCHQSTRLDAAFWSSLLTRREELRKVLPKRADKVTGGDIFSLLYYFDPVLKEETPDPALTAWLKRAMKNPDVQGLREKTVGDKTLAASGAIRLYREMMRPKESQLKVIVQLKDNQETMEALGANTPETEKMIDDLRQKIADDFESMDDGQVLGNIGTAAQNTQGDMDIAEELAKMDGGEGADPANFTERIMATMLNEALIDKVTSNDKLRGIMNVLGRMSPILEVAKSVQLKPQPTPVDVVFGDDLDRLVSVELLGLADPETEDLFYAKYADKGLLEYEHKDKPQEGRGPFVCVMDVSGSMRGTAEQYSLALFTAMARLSIKDKREVRLVYFADNASKAFKVEDSKSLIEALTATVKVGGGTRFQAGLDRAREVIEDGIGKQADILFISDGYGHVDREWLKKFAEWKEELGIKMVGVNIEGQWDGSYMKMFSAVTSLGSRGEMMKLDWLNEIKDGLVG